MHKGRGFSSSVHGGRQEFCSLMHRGRQFRTGRLLAVVCSPMLTKFLLALLGLEGWSCLISASLMLSARSHSVSAACRPSAAL